MVNFEMLSREARSFSGLQPPFQAKEIGRRCIGNETYIYYQDKNGGFWYISKSQIEFEKYVQEQKRLSKRVLT